MGQLADYLDAYRPEPLRGFGTVPFILPLTPSVTGAVAAIAAALAASQTAAEKARIDAQMWQLDAQWLGSASWASMRSCVRVKYFGGGVIATPWGELGADGCRNGVGSPVSSTCDWGFWRINRCDLDTASAQVFQIGRYLWAQARMRDLLASKPTPATDAQTAADWAWRAASLITALQWSTNIRFDNPNPNAIGEYANYTGDLVRQRLLFAPNSAPNAGFAYDGGPMPARPYYIPYSLVPRRINAIGNVRFAPTRQYDFFPGDGPLALLARGGTVVHPMFAQATPAGPAPYYSTVPLGISDAQAEDIRRATSAVYTAASDSDGGRWASTKAFNDFWFRATWTWSTMWRPLGEFHTRTTHTPSGPGGGAVTYGWSSTPSTVVIGGARMAVEQLAEQLRFYSDRTAPTNNYVAWMQSAMTTYNVNTSGVPSTTVEGAAFNAAKSQLLGAISSASSTAAAQALSGNPAGSAEGAYLQVGLSLFQTIVSLVGQSVPLIGTLYAGLNAVVQAITSGVGGAVGNTPCPAFPFIRVMSPSSGVCDLSTDDITSSLIGISSTARWPVALGGQTRAFVVDGRAFTVMFDAADTTADLVARRINAAAALVGLSGVATVRSGQVHVEGRDPGAGPARATGGTACSLGLPGPCAAAPPPGDGSGGSTPAKSSGLPLLVGAAIALRLLLGS